MLGWNLYSTAYLLALVVGFVALLVLVVLLCRVALAGRRWLVASARLRELEIDLLLADLETDAAVEADRAHDAEAHDAEARDERAGGAPGSVPPPAP